MIKVDIKIALVFLLIMLAVILRADNSSSLQKSIELNFLTYNETARSTAQSQAAIAYRTLIDIQPILEDMRVGIISLNKEAVRIKNEEVKMNRQLSRYLQAPKPQTQRPNQPPLYPRGGMRFTPFWRSINLNTSVSCVWQNEGKINNLVTYKTGFATRVEISGDHQLQLFGPMTSDGGRSVAFDIQYGATFFSGFPVNFEYSYLTEEKEIATTTVDFGNEDIVGNKPRLFFRILALYTSSDIGIPLTGYYAPIAIGFGVRLEPLFNTAKEAENRYIGANFYGSASASIFIEKTLRLSLGIDIPYHKISACSAIPFQIRNDNVLIEERNYREDGEVVSHTYVKSNPVFFLPYQTNIGLSLSVIKNFGSY